MASVFKGDNYTFYNWLPEGTGSFKLVSTEYSLKILSFKELCFSMPWKPDVHVYTLGAGWLTVTYVYLCT